MKIIIILFSLMLVACGSGEVDRLTKLNNDLKETLFKKENAIEKIRLESDNELKKYKESYYRMKFLENVSKNYKAILNTNYGKIKIEFFPEDAPIHVFAFISRAEAGFYNGLKFHRIMQGFMIQGGSPSSKDRINMNDGSGGPLLNIPFELNKRTHVPGILSAANIGDPTKGDGSQFFIMHGPSQQLDTRHTIFGKVIDGMDIVNKIAALPVHKKNDARNDVTLNMPMKPVIIKNVEIVRN